MLQGCENPILTEGYGKIVYLGAGNSTDLCLSASTINKHVVKGEKETHNVITGSCNVVFANWSVATDKIKNGKEIECLDAHAHKKEDGSRATISEIKDGANVHLYECKEGAENQQWEFYRNSKTIKLKGTTKCLTVGDTDNDVILQTC